MLKAISLKNIKYAIHEKLILQGVSFTCSVKERLCIFGENGAGKSTLLKILCGQIEPDEGAIQMHGHIRFMYVTQEFDTSYNDKTIEEYVKSILSESLYKKVFNISKSLGFGIEHNLSKTCGSLSGGQQKILVLSCAFAIDPDFLLLDEPENHLDIVSRVALISLLEQFKGGIIFISHDRLVIDRIATKVGEVAESKLHISEGGYDDYIQMKMERIGGLKRQFDTETKRIKQLSSSVIILQQKAFRGKEVSAYRKAKEELEQLKSDHKASGRPEERHTKIKISETDRVLHTGKLLCKIKDSMFKYKDAKSQTFNEVSLEIRSGQKIVLLGRNGSGKSTFLKCLTGHLALSKGEMNWSPDITWSYFDQHAEFEEDKTPIEIVMEKLNYISIEAQAALGAMRFDVLRMKTSIKNLSGGERMRLRFAITFGQKPDFLILDEPTNHIDEVTWEILLGACTTSKSSILLVTHDYEFIQAFSPSVFWVINHQKIEVRYKDLDVLLEELKK